VTRAECDNYTIATLLAKSCRSSGHAVWAIVALFMAIGTGAPSEVQGVPAAAPPRRGVEMGVVQPATSPHTALNQALGKRLGGVPGHHFQLDELKRVPGITRGLSGAIDG